MKKDIENILIEFSDEAGRLLSSIYMRYESASDKLDRRKDENVFRQLTAQYGYTLREELEKKALFFIDKYKDSTNNFTRLQRMLTGKIDFYLNEFDRKSGLQ